MFCIILIREDINIQLCYRNLIYHFCTMQRFSMSFLHHAEIFNVIFAPCRDFLSHFCTMQRFSMSFLHQAEIFYVIFARCKVPLYPWAIHNSTVLFTTIQIFLPFPSKCSIWTAIEFVWHMAVAIYKLTHPKKILTGLLLFNIARSCETSFILDSIWQETIYFGSWLRSF